MALSCFHPAVYPFDQGEPFHQCNGSNNFPVSIPLHQFAELVQFVRLLAVSIPLIALIALITSIISITSIDQTGEDGCLFHYTKPMVHGWVAV